MPETELVNQQDIKTDLLSKFDELLTDKCNVTIDTKDIVSIYHLGTNRTLILKIDQYLLNWSIRL